MAFHCGFVTIIGRPNSGKSTLVNRLVGQKVAIVSPRPQTTRNRIRGIVNRDDAQIVLIDTPGIHKPANALGRQMMGEVNEALEGIDLLLLIVDAAEEFGRGDRIALETVQRYAVPTILLLNKIDRIPKDRLLPLIDAYQKQYTFEEIIPISALKGDGVETLLQAMTSRLPEAEPHFPTDQYTDQPERFLAAEIVREKAIAVTREEVPYAVAVIVDTFEERPNIIHISATIYVEREGQKGILIGKGGSTLKKIGTNARRELEQVLGIKIFLELFVKVEPGWRDNRFIVRQLDWHQQLEQLMEHETENE